MAIAFRAASAVAAMGASSVTITKPTGTVQDDVMYAILNCNLDSRNKSFTIGTPPSGWTELVSITNSNSFNMVKVLRKAAGASEGSNYAFSYTHTDTVDEGWGAIVSWSGVDTTTPEDVASTTVYNSSASLNLTAPSITPVTAACELMSIYGLAPDGGGTDSAKTPPVGQTSRVNKLGTFAGFLVASEDLSSAGATGTRVATYTTGTNQSLCVSIALRPVGGASGSSLASRRLGVSPAGSNNLRIY